MRDEVSQLVDELVEALLGNATYTSMLYDMFSKHNEAVESYVKVGREFWHYDGTLRKYRKLKVTYVRTGVMFFVFEDDPETEHAWFISCFDAMNLRAAQIYPYEIGKILSKYHEGANTQFPKICRECKWNDCDGQITVDVIWDKEE